MKYIALTIGPIYKTLSNAKKTRELWAGSYIFSYIMKKIIEKFKDREFIVPNIEDKSTFEQGNEVGLFHDRFIFKSKDGDFDKLKEDIDKVLNHVGDIVAKHIKEDNETVQKFIKGYFQINFIEKELKGNPILELSPYLDTLEQYQKPTPKGKNYLIDFLKTSNGSYLYVDAFEERVKEVESLPEVATKELHTKYPKLKTLIRHQEDSDKLFDQIAEITDDDFENYHKYVAIVNADGDRMRRVIEESKNLKDISKKLFNFAKESHMEIKKYGGTTIYAGGDDLLFFAPVKNGDKTIFHLLESLSTIFNDKFEQATLSFGLSISYNKFPLYEALNISRSLLFDEAKKEPKNAIAFRVIKHSGQMFGATIPKADEKIYKLFQELLLSIDSDKDSKNFLGSFHHKLYHQKFLIDAIASDRNLISNYFENNFNKNEHVKYKEFFQEIGDFIYDVYKSNEIKEKHTLIYSTLRFIKFIKGDES